MNAFSIEEHFWIWSFCKKYWDWKLSWNPCKCTIWMHLQNNREKGPAKISCCHIKHFFIIGSNPPNRLWTVVGHIFFWVHSFFFILCRFFFSQICIEYKQFVFIFCLASSLLHSSSIHHILVKIYFLQKKFFEIQSLTLFWSFHFLSKCKEHLQGSSVLLVTL